MPTFWDHLRIIVPGPNTIGDITQQGETFISEAYENGNNPGRIMVEATPMGGGGFQLRKTNNGGPNVKSVYWLPWKNDSATLAERAWFEEKDGCDFFMTTALTGCRFTLTPTHVLHIANNATVPGSRAFGASARRTEFEDEFTGGTPPLTRRLSTTTYHDHRTLVFGVRQVGGWVYKAYFSDPAPGTWGNI